MWMMFQSLVISEAVQSLNSKNLLIDADGVPSWSIFPLLWKVSHPGHGTKIMRGKNLFVSVNSEMYQSFSLCFSLMPRRSWSRHQKCKRCPSTVYINVYVCILTSKSILQSSTELAHAGYIYIVFCVLLIVLCFYIMFLLSWVRSLGRCF